MDMKNVIGNIIILEIAPAKTDIRIISIIPIHFKWKIKHINLAKIAKNSDKTIVNINEAERLVLSIGDHLNSGSKVPIWRLVLNLDAKDPNILPLIPIAPGIRTRSPGNKSKK